MREYLKYVIIALAVVAMLVMIGILVHHERRTQYHKPPIKISKVIERFEQSKYFAIQQVAFEKGIYRAIGYDIAGNKVKITFNIHTGIISATPESPHVMPILIVAHKVESLGYPYIFNISFEQNRYVVKCLNKANKMIQLQVDPKTYVIEKL